MTKVRRLQKLAVTQKRGGGGATTGGTNTGGTNTGGTSTGTGGTSTNTGGTGTNTGGTNTGTGGTSTGTGGTSTNTGGTSTGTGGTSTNTGGTSTATTPITSQEIDKLLQELKDGGNTADHTLKGNLEAFLEEVKTNSIDNNSKKLYLLSAIQYNNVQGYNTKDVLTLAIDKLTDIINTSFQGKTFLQHADHYNNTEARKLLVQKGAK